MKKKQQVKMIISAWYYDEEGTVHFIFNREIDYLPMFASKNLISSKKPANLIN